MSNRSQDRRPKRWHRDALLGVLAVGARAVGALAVGVLSLGAMASALSARAAGVLVPDTFTRGSLASSHLVPQHPVSDGLRCDDSAVPPLRWSPETPRAGALFRVVLPAPVTEIPLVRVAGEPLHFHAVGDSVRGDSLVALAAVPVDSVSGVTLTWTCEGSAPGTHRIRTEAGAYALEELKVAPRFGAPASAAVTARTRREAAQAIAVSTASHATPRLWDVPFMVPRTSRITSPFGGGRVFNGAVSSRHMGTDYAGAVGAPVHAVNRGVVRLIGEFYLGGNVIYLDHGDGIVTAYLHLSRQLVAVGDTVARGQVIGHVGATGRVTGPHLHLIARYGTITIDPASLFELWESDSADPGKR